MCYTYLEITNILREIFINIMRCYGTCLVLIRIPLSFPRKEFSNTTCLVLIGISLSFPHKRFSIDTCLVLIGISLPFPRKGFPIATCLVLIGISLSFPRTRQFSLLACPDRVSLLKSYVY